MRVALVHEFLTQYGGAERVLEAFHELFPEAPVYTLVYDKEKLGRRFRGWDIRTSVIQKFPGGVRNYKWYLPMMPRAVERFDLSEYELVLSDSSAFAKGVKTGAKHICYCHTPTRYLWVEMDEYVKNYPFSGLIKSYLKSTIRPWDYKAAQKPDVMIANSETVRERIKRFYNRAAQVIYPPVDSTFFKSTSVKQDYFLTTSRLEPYKKIDLVVKAFNNLSLPLKVVGTGTELSKLKKSAKSNIEFLGTVSDERLRDLYSGARAFIFPALEDAGIAVLESLSCATPVIGYLEGGTSEFVVDGENGLLFSEQSVDEIIKAVNRFQTMNFDSKKLRVSVLGYDKENFKKKIKKIVNTSLSL